MQVIQNLANMPAVDLIMIGGAVLAVAASLWLDRVKFRD